MKYDAIILAAGSGRRMGINKNKIFLSIDDKPIFQYSVDLFKADSDCQKIILVGKKEEQGIFTSYLSENIVFAVGGQERQDSVRNALKLVESDYVMIHDGARPFINQRELNCLKKKPNSILAVPVKDTIKQVESDGKIKQTIPRETLFSAQTPQCFQSDLIINAHMEAFENNFLGTDDASLIEEFGEVSVSIVEGSYNNIKVTTPEDILMARLIKERMSTNG
ncbi:2-C-methyl-D-erythritol 4-phosphate cytidylyltransferase [Floricoccus tropicus]|uniref:2-C-methyl-D-erythritol 4-phosphate cytidylyltransferase n=1 Tax=Floricoccus tropicus TaxID=1859473 RepID=A0A1E8GND1_9LACT|nr:2-C-methyl-D-erythritol 4-phosphate cytidylyltransferase [Floricoccus tropicus]OFI49018.1 2-C-methyl-D-erythritol 4-phosphate cytidylyltransferase [Floricoccus tropicus]